MNALGSKWTSLGEAQTVFAYRGNSLFTVNEEGGFYIFYGPDWQEAHRHSTSMKIDSEGFHLAEKGSDVFPNNSVYANRVNDLILGEIPAWVPRPISGAHPAVVVTAFLNWKKELLPKSPHDVDPTAYLPS